MNIIENADKNMWVLCHNGIDIFHTVELGIGQNLATGQPFMEKFNTIEEFNQKLIELGLTITGEYVPPVQEIINNQIQSNEQSTSITNS